MTLFLKSALLLSCFIAPALFAQTVTIEDIIAQKEREKTELRRKIQQIEEDEKKLLILRQAREQKQKEIATAQDNTQTQAQTQGQATAQAAEHKIVVPAAQDDPVTQANSTAAAAAQAVAAARAAAMRSNVGQGQSAQTTVAAKTSVSSAKRADVNLKSASLRTVTSSGRKYVNLRDVAKVYGLTFAATKTGGALTGNKGLSAVFSSTSREGSLCGRKTYYLFPMIYSKNTPYISELDLYKVIDPIFRNSTVAKLGMKTIMIDPGHGGKDPGAMYGKYQEKALNLQIAAKLKTSLEKLGFKVVMTRNSDTFPELSDRTNLCAKVKPDLFISIHCNASPSSSAISGVETFSVTPVGASSTSGTTIETTAKSSNAYELNSTRLAHEIHSAVLKSTGAADRGVRKSRFYVVTNTTCPSILLEVGYLSCPSEAARIGTSAYQTKIVTGILNGLAAYGNFLR